MTTAPLLSVENLQTHFITFDGVAKAVDDVSFGWSAARPSASWAKAGAARA